MAAVSFLFMGMLLGLGECSKRPIIGVMTQELETPGWRNYSSFVPSQYVKAVEAAGGRVVPVFIGQPLQYYRNLTSWLNGLFVPGGSSLLHTPGGIAETLTIVYDLAKKVNDKGGWLPVLGVCQGMELLAWLSSERNDSVLISCSSEDRNLPLNFRPGFLQSSLYGRASIEDIELLSRLPVTSNHHRLCVTESSLKKTGAEGRWKVLSTNADWDGVEFVSSMEDVKYPFVGVQFHPEKPAWEWSLAQENPHSPEAVRANRLFYDWLVREAWRSPTSFPSPDLESRYLIYNYSPLYIGKFGQYDTQAFFFYDPKK